MSDIDDEVRNFARLLASRRGSSGRQPPPVIGVSESSFDPTSVDLGINTPPRSEPIPGGGGGVLILPPPSPTGACCLPDGGGCTVLTSSACDALGGTWQGEDVPCFPDPCPPLPSCALCYFLAFDGSGRKFLTRTVQSNGTITCPDCIAASYLGVSETWTAQKVESYAPGSCTLSCSYSGSGSATSDETGLSCRGVPISCATEGSSVGIISGLTWSGHCDDCDDLTAPCFPSSGETPPTPSESHTATEKTETFTGDGIFLPTHHYSCTRITTLSDECT